MTSFLLITLYAPLAAWGDVTVGERRTSWDRPSRSAVLGLVAGALGLKRDDQAGHDALDAGCGMAVRVDALGRAAEDYHTTQSLPQPEVYRGKPATRRDAIRYGEQNRRLETILSMREYRVDAAYTVAIWARDGARWPLQALCGALKTPHFVLYAGRKANVLAWPLQPNIIEAKTLADAFNQRPALDGGPLLAALRPPAGPRSVSCDDDFAIDRGLSAERIERRRDAHAQRTRWQFAERRVITGLIPTTVEPTP
jgi:CRISPR system Cascade subunit CasD